VSPYLEPRGVGLLLDSLLDALRRAVCVTLLTHGAEVLNSLSSTSLKSLRRESDGLSGSLLVLTATESLTVLLHSKLIVADSTRALLGSANVTGKGLGQNLEAGVLLGPKAAGEIERVVAHVIASGIAVEVFRSRRLSRED
jgi:phosphatidylserine/phosphatidylglycerophosphate/cardiolipin synthase-like enzyme